MQVRVLGVAIDARSQPVILLKPLGEEAGAGRVLPIWIGSQEATSILLAVGGEQAPRPLSHDLMITLLAETGAELERVEVTRIEDGTFYAELTLRTREGRRILDCRPSDAIALASRSGSPIWVADDVLQDAGIPDTSDGSEDSSASDDEENRVAEFKKFLDQVGPEDFQG